MHVPGKILQRLDKSTDQKREGARICVKLIRALRRMQGISGVHVMAHRNEGLVPEILRESGLTQERNNARGLPGVS